MKKKTFPNRDKKGQSKFLGYPLYAPDEDVFIQWHDVNETAIDDVLDFTDDEDSEDPLDLELDVPGSELDDAQEEIGSEDEENNYYSLGGDNHDDLEEDRAV